MANESTDESGVDFFQAVVNGVESAKEEVLSPGWIRRAEPQGALRGLERGGIDSTQDGSDGYDQGKLAIHLAGDTWQEGGWQENRDEDKRDANDRPEKIIHRRDGRILGGLPKFDVFRRPFHDDDGIIHHNPDGQHDGEKREGIDGETERRHAGEGPDDGHRDGRCRDECGPPVLQEKHDDEKHKQTGFEDGFVNFLHGLTHKNRGVEGHLVVNAGRKGLREFLHFFPNLSGYIKRVGAGKLENGNAAGGLAIECKKLPILLRAKFHAGHIAETCDLSAVLGIGLHNDLLKIRSLAQRAIDIDRESEGL